MSVGLGVAIAACVVAALALLIAFVESSEFKLVETLAHRTALLILEEFGIEWVRLSINKPGAIRHSKDVGVAVLRTRADLPK